MKVFKLTVMIVDHDGLGSGEAISEELECGRFGNRCISPRVMKTECRDIGEWTDEHPLNCDDTDVEAFEDMFDAPYVGDVTIDSSGCVTSTRTNIAGLPRGIYNLIAVKQ